MPTTIPLVHDGLDRPYLLHSPRAGTASRVPLLLGLHGRGIDGAWFDRLTGFSSLADEAGFALVLPNAIDERWNDGRNPAVEMTGGPDDVGYLRAVIDDVIARLPIDDRRIYIVGLSNGASMAGRLACMHAEWIAGIAQVAGTAALDVVAGAHPSRPVPILNIHGTADPHAPYRGGVRRSLRGRVLLRPAGRPSVGVTTGPSSGWPPTTPSTIPRSPRSRLTRRSGLGMAHPRTPTSSSIGLREAAIRGPVVIRPCPGSCSGGRPARSARRR